MTTPRRVLDVAHGDRREWLAIWAAAAAAARGLVAAPGSDPRAWWDAVGPVLATYSGARLFDTSAPHVAELLDVIDPAPAALDPGLIGDGYAAAGPSEARKRAGRFYTPRNTVAESLEGVVSDDATAVLDPACGGGRFLLGALELLAPGGPSARRAEIAERAIFGIDADPLAIDVCRVAIWLASATAERPRVDLGPHLVVGDPLRGEVGLELPPAVNLGRRFDRTFDAVVGNPPYRGGRHRPVGDVDAALRAAFAVAEYQLDPYALFLELGLRYLAPNGRLAMVVPNAWMSNLRAGRMRRFLLERHTLDCVVELPVSAFGAEVETIVVHLSRMGQTAAEVPIWAIGDDGHRTRRGALLYDADTPDAPLPIARDARAHRLLTGSRRWTRTLGDVAEVTRGINPYHRATHTPEQIADRVHHADHRVDDTYVPELCGRDLGPYRLWWSGARWVSYGPWLKEPRDPRFFDGPRLLVRKIIGKTLCAAYAEDRLCCDQSVYIARLRPGQPWPAGAVLAFLSSHTIVDLLRARHQEDDQLFPQLKVIELRNAPLPPVDPGDPRVAALAGAALALQAAESAQFEALDAFVAANEPGAAVGRRAASRAQQLRKGWPAGLEPEHPAVRRAGVIAESRAEVEEIVAALYGV